MERQMNNNWRFDIKMSKIGQHIAFCCHFTLENGGWINRRIGPGGGWINRW
jgi:hypothetical protein